MDEHENSTEKAVLAAEDDEAFAAELRRRRDEALRDPRCLLPVSALDQDEDGKGKK